MERIKPAKQVYSNYTKEDFKVWKVLFNRQMENLRKHASADYLEALGTIGFNEAEIPDFEKVNETLKPLTGWKIITVQGICPPVEFFRLLSQKTFTCTCWLRTMQELDYLEEPDMFHDVFGHLPLLTNPAYCEFFQALGSLGVKYIHDQEVIDMLERLYWFTIEFGLIRENEELKIYGSGIISSVGETLHAIGDRSKKFDFDVERIMDHSFRTDIIQEEYFVIESLEQLVDALPLAERKISEFLKVREVA
jgi:phenylalanine-4-hydroxylase